MKYRVTMKFLEFTGPDYSEEKQHISEYIIEAATISEAFQIATQKHIEDNIKNNLGPGIVNGVDIRQIDNFKKKG